MKIETGNKFQSYTGTVYTVTGFVEFDRKVKVEVHSKDGATYTDVLTQNDIRGLVKLGYWQKVEA